MKLKLFVAIIILSVFVLACSSVSDKDIYESGKKKIEDRDYAGAVVDFQKIVNEYPDGKYGVNALYELAKLYHGHVISSIPKEESLSKAVELYKQVSEKNPKSTMGEKSLFMAGFLEANELQRIKDAEKTYKLFLEKYPDSPLAASAKEEIKNLGIPPEEILKAKVSTAE